MSKSQVAAIARFRNHLESTIRQPNSAKHGAAITEWEITEHNFGVAVRAQVELTGLSSGNLPPRQVLSHH